MSTYAIGDVQGCFDELLQLLDKINFDESKDHLWFTGDLINRGHQSYQTVKFIKTLYEKGRAISVLGNHDLGFLTIARGAEPFKPDTHTFKDILDAPDKEEILLFLEQLPLMYVTHQYIMVHAGIYPNWDLTYAKKRAEEVEAVLRSSEKYDFYPHLYGNTPTHWSESLPKFERLRFIVNSFARMRFCSTDGALDLESKEAANNPPAGFIPWFNIPTRKTKENKIIFGHWAALNGKTDAENLFALDTGCVWGRSLTAFRLEDEQRFEMSCKRYQK